MFGEHGFASAGLGVHIKTVQQIPIRYLPFYFSLEKLGYLPSIYLLGICHWMKQETLLLQRDRARHLSVEIQQLQNISLENPIVWHYLRDSRFSEDKLPSCFKGTQVNSKMQGFFKGMFQNCTTHAFCFPRLTKNRPIQFDIKWTLQENITQYTSSCTRLYVLTTQIYWKLQILCRTRTVR